MNQFQPSRVHTEFRDQISHTHPIIGRKYMVTHSDDTAELYITIGRQYAEDKVGSLRDEVRMEIVRNYCSLQIFGLVLIDDKKGKWNSELRSEIFLREMPLAIMAVRYADRVLFETYPMLDCIPIRIQFQSEKRIFQRMYDFGEMNQFVW